jgi:YD repeat-containing protein
VASTDPLGNATRNQYDSMGRVQVSTNARGLETHYGYDAMGRVTAVADKFGNAVLRNCRVIN